MKQHILYFEFFLYNDITMILALNSMFKIILYLTQNVNLDKKKKKISFESMDISCHRTGTKHEEFYTGEILSTKTK